MNIAEKEYGLKFYIQKFKHIVQLHFEQAEQTLRIEGNLRGQNLFVMGISMEIEETSRGLSFILLMSFHPGCVTGRTGYIIGGTQYRRKMQYFLINIHLEKIQDGSSGALAN